MTSEEFERYLNARPGVLSVRGAASFFHVHPITMLRLIRKGELKTKKDANGQRADMASCRFSRSNPQRLFIGCLARVQEIPNPV
jgi:hypothetical protein